MTQMKTGMSLKPACHGRLTRSLPATTDNGFVEFIYHESQYELPILKDAEALDDLRPEVEFANPGDRAQVELSRANHHKPSSTKHPDELALWHHL
ncbi:MAG: hypothetical protein M1816_001727 [Peltula sp. TS41687]|nr:MAG: hypothetical protein M1816_001727 [Peltula sp. TS41687]